MAQTEIAKTPEPPYYAAIFTSLRTAPPGNQRCGLDLIPGGTHGKTFAQV